MSAHGSKPIPPVPASPFHHGPFGRLFRNLPTWEPAGETEQEKLDAIHTLSQSAFEAFDDPALDNGDIPAGYTYLGQFVDHDITFDPTSELQRLNDPDRIRNFRTPRFDLDNIYGRGPDDQPYLYAQDGAGKLLIGSNNRGEPDLPRNRDSGADTSDTDDFSRFRTALIGDPRNDENIIVSQLQLAFLGFHNRRVDEGAGFEEARRFTRWHYQWVVVHDFLKRLCGADLVDALLCGKCQGQPDLCFFHYRNAPFMPVEFSVAAYRLGHSMVRPGYQLSETLDGLRGGNPLAIFGGQPQDNLRGGRELPPFWTIQWDRFVEHQGSDPQKSRKLDTKLAPPLVDLPISPEARLRSLAFRNLLRGWRMSLPSGQSVARRMGIQVVDGAPLTGDDPLWLYVLAEANQVHGGARMGPVGARIVAEVFVGLLAGDPFSYYSVNPGWKPELSSAGGEFTLGDFLQHAGAPDRKSVV